MILSKDLKILTVKPFGDRLSTKPHSCCLSFFGYGFKKSRLVGKDSKMNDV